MNKIARISKIKKIENNLRQQEKEKEKTQKEQELDFDSMLKEEEKKLNETQQKRKKGNTLDVYKYEIQKNTIIQKKIQQINNEENEHDEK